MARYIASDIEARDLIEVAGWPVAIVKVERIVEDETWIYATDINDDEYEWRENEPVTILDSKIDPYLYINLCEFCHRPNHLCACP